MEKIIMLGNGCSGTLDIYNTCFVIQNGVGNFLVDTGGSNEIMRRLSDVNINFTDLEHIFISHSHIDHVLGLIWLFKKMGLKVLHGEMTDKVNIYCNDEVCETIKVVADHVISKKLTNAVYSIINFVVLEDGDTYNINGVDYTFFDIHAKGNKQFGFECVINDKKLVFYGDQPCKPELYYKAQGADYVMHEAFCLDSEEYIFHPYEKNHSTAKSAGEIMNGLDVKNLILYHTEETHKEMRKELYTKEAQEYFDGTVIVPNDLEVIELKKTLK